MATTTWAYRGIDPGRLAARGGRHDRGGRLTANRHQRADVRRVETKVCGAEAQQTADMEVAIEKTLTSALRESPSVVHLKQAIFK